MSRRSTQQASEWTSRNRPIREDMGFQRRLWRFQRVGWIVLVLLAVAAVLGLFSQGVLSENSAVSGDNSFRVTYQTFLRSGAAASLHIDMGALPAAAPAERELVFSPAMLDALAFETIRPTPIRAGTHPDGLHLLFAVPPGGGRIHIGVRPQHAGYTPASVRRAGSDGEARFWFFTYP